ncbi:hypothetical protein AHAS_Ahas02G0189100 [Arachis hypogaea]
MLSNNNTTCIPALKMPKITTLLKSQSPIPNLPSSTLFALLRRTPTSPYMSASVLEPSTTSLVRIISCPPLPSFTPPSTATISLHPPLGSLGTDKTIIARAIINSFSITNALVIVSSLYPLVSKMSRTS